MTTNPRLDHIDNKGHSVVTSAINDPFGARLVLLEYGRLADFPPISVGPVSLKGGEAGWIQAINNAQPLWLGVIWQRIELIEYQLQEQRDKIQRLKATVHKHAQTKEDDQMPVLEWTASTGTEPGTYSCVVESITEEDGNFGAQLKFIFVVLDDDGDKTDDKIFGWTSAKWGEKAKLYKWAKQLLLKKCPAPEQPLDTDRLIGKKCDLVIAAKKRADGSPGSGIEDMYPYRTVNALAKEDELSDEDPANFQTIPNARH